MLYRFITKTTMKEYNARKWYIDRDIIPEQEIEADTLPEAIEQWRQEVRDRYYIDISKNAIRNKAAMYIDTAAGPKQTGYVITGKTDFQDNYYRWTSQYIDLWTEITEISAVNFEA